MIQRPDTQDEMVNQIWYVLVGMNGTGIISRVERMEPMLMELYQQHKQARSSFRFWLPLLVGSVIQIAVLAVMILAMKGGTP